MTTTVTVDTQLNTDTSNINFWATQGYSQGFFECYKDPITCVLFCCFGPCMLGHTVGQLDGKGFNFVACCCGGVSVYRLRRDVQQRYGISEHEDASTCAAGVCGTCAAIQDAHELQGRGAVKAVVTSQPQ